MGVGQEHQREPLPHPQPHLRAIALLHQEETVPCASGADNSPLPYLTAFSEAWHQAPPPGQGSCPLSPRHHLPRLLSPSCWEEGRWSCSLCCVNYGCAGLWHGMAGGAPDSSRGV